MWIRRPRVFVLDDQALVADSIASVLNAAGYEAHARYRPSDILDLATELIPDLLITDVALGPNTINGFDLAIYFERFYPECHAILISGDPNSADLLEKSRRSGHDFLLLQKPIHPEKLMEHLNAALRHLQTAA